MRSLFLPLPVCLMFVLIAGLSTNAQASWFRLCDMKLEILGGGKLTAGQKAGINARYTTLPPDLLIPDSSKIPEKLTYDAAVAYIDGAERGDVPTQQLMLLMDFLGKNRLANQVLEVVSPETKTLSEVLAALEPEVTTLEEAHRASQAVQGLGNIFRIVSTLRFSPVLSTEVRQQLADGPYKTTAYLFGTRLSQIAAVRLAHAYREKDPGLADISKFDAAFLEEFNKPQDMGDPALTVKAYLPAVIKSKKLGIVVSHLKQWFRHGVFEFEGTKTWEVEKRFQFEGDIEALRLAIKQLPNQTLETREALAEGSQRKVLCLHDEILHCVQDSFCLDSSNRDRN